MSTSIVWFRQDLRLNNNLALKRAIQNSRKVIFLYLLDKNQHTFSIGSASKWWLQKSLISLDNELRKRGSQLILKIGSPIEILLEICRQYKISTVYWNHTYDEFALREETKLIKRLNSEGIQTEVEHSNLLVEPWEVQSKSSSPYKVFTPFTYALEAILARSKLTSATISGNLSSYHLPSVTSEQIKSMNLYSANPDWAVEFDKVWDPGEQGAKRQWQHFLRFNLKNYSNNRDFPSKISTSCISPYLHFGEICITEIFRSLSPEHDVLKKEFYWREFAHHLLYHFPQMIQDPLKSLFEHFPWSYNKEHFRIWQQGLTGIPIIDAGMRQLYTIGWMHNRIRMLVGSFLVKNLLIPWQWGAHWFWDTLVDADLANNSMNWQWVAGCGVDAAPYFRIFNPVLQSKRFDQKGEYIKKWVPELSQMDHRHIHEPWLAEKKILDKAGVILDKTYPLPIVDLNTTRKRALSLHRTLVNQSQS